jgi:thiol-disulfide isomerase/thioredoxin
MNLHLLAACLCAAGSSLVAAPFSDLSFEAASRQAEQTGKIVLVDFYTTWCGPCKLLDKNTWTDPAVIQLLEEKTVALRIDAEKEADLSKHYKIAAYPSVLLIKPDGAEIDRLVGYREPKAFLEDFNAALRGKDSVSRAKDKLAAAGTNNASARMELGQALEQRGKYAEALAEYLWCFDHGLEADSAFSGVRVSFLLMNIKNLAAHYPPAQQALETRRDESQAKVTAGSTDYQTMTDLISLNNTLDQKEKSFAVFDQLPDGSRGRELILTMLADQFLEAKRYTDVLQGTDGQAAFKEAVDRFSQMLNALGKDNPLRERMVDNFRQFTTKNGAQHFEALAGLKRNEDGKELAGQILKFDASPATHTLLATAALRAGNDELARFVQQSPERVARASVMPP